LRHARNALLGQAEKDSTERAGLVQELDKTATENKNLATLLQDSKRELEKFNEQVEDLERRLSECHHHFLDQRARADSQEISLGALRLRLKYLSNKDLAPPTRTSTESLLISSGRGALEEFENAWEAFVPPRPVEDDASGELEIASETEQNSDCDQSVSTVRQSTGLASELPRSSSLKEEILEKKPLPRALSDPSPTSETNFDLSRVTSPPLL
jgi:DNA repair exonuclease SbcCD ATPase subunit